MSIKDREKALVNFRELIFMKELKKQPVNHKKLMDFDIKFNLTISNPTEFFKVIDNFIEKFQSKNLTFQDNILILQLNAVLTEYKPEKSAKDEYKNILKKIF